MTLNPLIGDESAIQPFIQAISSSAAANDEWLLITDITIELIATTSDVMTKGDENLQLLKSAIKKSTYKDGIYDNTLIVKSDGTGGFTNLRDAILSITNSSALNCYEIITYNSHETVTLKFTSVADF